MSRLWGGVVCVRWTAPRAVLALLLLLFAAGTLATSLVSESSGAPGLWPVALAVGATLVVGPRGVLPVLGLVTVVATAAMWLGGLAFGLAAGHTLAMVVAVGVVWWLLTGGRGGRPGLRSSRQLATFLGASFAGALVAAVLSSVVSVLAGFAGGPAVVAVSVGTAHLASYLTLLPFFCRLPDHAQIASRVERAAQWSLTLGIAPLLFLPRDFPSLVFLILPLFAWGALRLRPVEALAQMVLVLNVAGGLGPTGRGPFAMVPQGLGLPQDARGVVLASFAIVCALTVVPLLLAVGEQVAQARQVAAERDKLESVVRGATGVAIIGVGQDGLIDLFNPGAERLLGYRAEEVLGRSTRMLHSPESVSAMARQLRVADDFVTVALALTDPRNAGMRMRFLRKDGVEREHALTLSRMRDEHGTTIGFVSTSEDITDQVRAEAALAEALAAEQEALERLREVDSVKDVFVSSVSHELRTPITSIVGYLEMLQDGSFGDLTGPQLDAVSRVAGNSARLLDLIDDLLTLSRLHEDGIAVAPRVFDLRQVVRNGWGVVAPVWQQRSLQVDLTLPPDPVPIVGDKDMSERVVVNLLSNAVKFTPDGGQVSVSLTVQGGEARLAVRDTGIGIPRAEQERLFTRFFRSSNAQRRAIPGSGLGLSISRAIVEKHGGSIEVHSEAERGSTFQVRMPIVA